MVKNFLNLTYLINNVLAFSLKDIKINKKVFKIKLKINEQDMQEIKSNPSYIIRMFDEYKTLLYKLLKGNKYFKNLAEGEVFAIFAGIVAYQLAPYGSTKLKYTFEEMLNAKYLKCDYYSTILAKFCELSNFTNIEVSIIGWHGGTIANHSQVIIKNNNNKTELLLDPTIGIVAYAGFNEIASGEKIKNQMILDYSTRYQLDESKNIIIKALCCGEYKPSDLLYYYESIDHMYYKGSWASNKLNWPTPGAKILRKEQKI